MSTYYVYILVSLNPDRTDCSGNKYPKIGHIESKAYFPDDNNFHGLYGSYLGKIPSHWVNTDPQAVWSVVKCENNDEIIFLDKRANFVKFRSGMVVFDGSREECEQYIESHLTPAILKEPVLTA